MKLQTAKTAKKYEGPARPISLAEGIALYDSASKGARLDNWFSVQPSMRAAIEAGDFMLLLTAGGRFELFWLKNPNPV